ncbi:MAG: peptide-methionine (S)-S-oxide reductase [Coxiellaceae bacterium]|nr:peptide-methionine (S)-S-oxide reductase [Coxiellaceae bacterium]|tara:strand:+ start:5175 stop:6029 length:855 start_codon:yes stop_codon:yes gene_type:complete
MLKTASLTPPAHQILIDKGTEMPGSSPLQSIRGHGTYCCRQCGIALFRSHHQFSSSCGWPSFDDEIPDRIQRYPDSDGRRTEIVCAQCQGHLGHVFHDEYLTDKNRRHCVNGLALDFTQSETVLHTEEAIFAAGCFWGVEHWMQQQPGVILTEVGYTGGTTSEPHYASVCSGTTGHVEAIRVLFDTAITDYQTLCQLFFEIHDPTDHYGQGPDRGEQYLSRIYCHSDTQETISHALIKELEDNGLNVATHVEPASIFWPAEHNHQQYYQKNGQTPYCHQRVKRF